MKGVSSSAESPAGTSLSMWNFIHVELVVMLGVPFSPTKQERAVKRLSAVLGIGY
jgi:hypothetical protein